MERDCIDYEGRTIQACVGGARVVLHVYSTDLEYVLDFEGTFMGQRLHADAGEGC